MDMMTLPIIVSALALNYILIKHLLYDKSKGYSVFESWSSFPKAYRKTLMLAGFFALFLNISLIYELYSVFTD